MNEEFLVPNVREVASMEDILGDTTVEYADIEGINGKVMRIGSLCAEDLIEHQEANEGPAKRNAGLRLIVKSLVDAKGERIGRSEHVERLKKVRVAVTERILREILKLNGLGKEAEAAAKKD